MARKVRLLVGNICQRPAMSQVRVDLDLLDVRDAKADIVMLNEIGLDRYKTAVGRILHDNDWDMNFLYKTQDPIAVARNRRMYAGLLRSKKLNDGVKMVTPSRHLNTVKVYFEDLDEWVVFMNTHWVSGKNNHLRFRRKLRKKLWRKNWELTKKEVEYWNDRGYWVVIAGDVNDKTVNEFNDQMVWHFTGIIKVGISPPTEPTDVVVKIEDESAITKVFTDKPLRIIDLMVYKKASATA